jgi:hypothetical protein
MGTHYEQQSEPQGNVPGKVIRNHKMMRDSLVATLICQGGDAYKLEVVKDVGGLTRLIKSAPIKAASNRLAIKKMQRWLDVRYPVKATVPQVDSKRAQLEALFI